MGSFYVNICVQNVLQSQIANILENIDDQAIIGPEQNGWCGFVSNALDSQDLKLIDTFLEGLSRKFGTHAVSVLNHDEDILAIRLWKSGGLIAEYSSCPGYFRRNPSDADLQAAFINMDAFVALASNTPDSEFRHRMLDGDDGYVDTLEAHAFFIRALGLPDYTLGFGFRDASREQEWSDPIRFLRVDPSSSA